MLWLGLLSCVAQCEQNQMQLTNSKCVADQKPRSDCESVGCPSDESPSDEGISGGPLDDSITSLEH